MNFPSHFGNMVVGFLIIFYGLSSTFYSQIYSNFYAGKSAEVSTGAFLLFLALSVLVINGAGKPKKKKLDEGVSLAGKR